MNNIESLTKKRCQAMKDAGVKDPESAEGILFCAGNKDIESRCPYPYCVVFEHSRKAKTLAVDQKVRLAKDLRNHGVSIEDIALILERRTFTIRRYLRRK